jgi:hypothetical protein
MTLRFILGLFSFSYLIHLDLELPGFQRYVNFVFQKGFDLLVDGR